MQLNVSSVQNKIVKDEIAQNKIVKDWTLSKIQDKQKSNEMKDVLKTISIDSKDWNCAQWLTGC